VSLLSTTELLTYLKFLQNRINIKLNRKLEFSLKVLPNMTC